MSVAAMKARLRAILTISGTLLALMATLPASSQPALQSSAVGLDLSARDLSVRPGDDFFRYALGTWEARAVISDDQAEAGVDVEVAERVQGELRELIERSASTPQTPIEARIGALYRSFMDEARVERLDDKPLRQELELIKASTTHVQFAHLMGLSYRGFGASFFSLRVAPDARRPVNTLVLGQGDLGMPDRDYYLEPGMREARAAYQSYVQRALSMVGWPRPDAAARQVVGLETEIARASWKRAQSRDLSSTYNPLSVGELDSYAPGVAWRTFLAGAAVRGAKHLVLAENTAVRELARLFAATPLDTLKAWETFRTVDAESAYLSSRFVASRFHFRGEVLSGATTMRPRWKRGVALVDGSIGQALGRAYVARYFEPRTKAQMTVLVEHLKEAMHTRILASTWMSAPTQREALEKLTRMKVFVGYPDAWRDYGSLRVDPEDLHGNVARSIALDWGYQVSKVGRPVDLSEWGPFDWGIQPQTVDAFNIAAENKIIFPAAILQPPYFDPDSDPAANYGAIGGIIGHEITHGFDDQGRKIDASGALRDWWAPADAAHYAVESEKLVRQFDAYEALPGIRLNGRQLLGENIADLSGLLLALDAYHASLGGAPAPVIDGLSGDQRVFLGWSSRWRRKLRADSLRQQVSADVHAPAEFRIIGPMRNIDTWYSAFGVQPGDRLYLEPQERARIW
jgi:putative endopeptidase